MRLGEGAAGAERGRRITVQRDLREHHDREVSLALIQSLAAETAKVVMAREDRWTYTSLTPPDQAAVIALGYDGTCEQTCGEGWKQVMVGTMTLYDSGGEPLETLCQANAPEDGKATFLSRMDREVAALKNRYPDALSVGVSDGAADLRAELGKHCGQLILDFWHAAGYIVSAGQAMTVGAGAHGELTAAQWTDQALHRLKTEEGGAVGLLAEMERRLDNGPRLAKAERAELERAAGYFANNLDRMDYAAALRENLPIGSGITEAACKTIVKARLCGGGMRWHPGSMQQVLSLRALRRSSNRWDQFWTRIDRQGF
ncbi:MAG: hypothetical protein JWM59_29 [Verrucomicrobiales bacterium]|nr:hypothetical protein [Verrucomicrobiales bacterium]